MTTVALSHGYPPLWNMGGEVSLHRSMKAINGDKFVLTDTDEQYEFEGVNVKKIDTPDALNIDADPKPIAKQLKDLNARVVIGQNELSLPAVLAAKEADAISIVNVHTPPKYGSGIAKAMLSTDYAVYNTKVSAIQWGDQRGFVLHPPISPMPDNFSGGGDAYTLLSSLVNKGVEVVLELAKKYPDKRFIIVRSPAEKTHGLKDLESRADKLSNVELHPRVAPEEVHKYLEQTKVLLVPSRYETYGMSAIEAAGYGIPSIHVDTPHVREGIGDAALLVPPLGTAETARAMMAIDKRYDYYSDRARTKAEWLHERQVTELESFAKFIDNLDPDVDNRSRHRVLPQVMKRYRLS
jgi:glycosyltransferase involved in cell wall biosynthesis